MMMMMITPRLKNKPHRVTPLFSPREGRRKRGNRITIHFDEYSPRPSPMESLVSSYLKKRNLGLLPPIPISLPIPSSGPPENSSKKLGIERECKWQQERGNERVREVRVEVSREGCFYGGAFPRSLLQRMQRVSGDFLPKLSICVFVCEVLSKGNLCL